MQAGNLVVAVFVPPWDHGKYAEPAPAAAESFVKGLLLAKRDRRIELFYLLAALDAPLKRRFLCIYGILTLLMTDEEGGHDLDEHGGVGKGFCEHCEKIAHLFFGEVHGSAFHENEDGAARMIDLRQPRGIKDGGGQLVYAHILFGQQPLAQRHDIGQVEVVPVDLSVIHAIKARVKTAGKIDADCVGVLFDESGRFMIEDVTAHGNACLRIFGAGELGEVIVDLLDELYGKLISNQTVRPFRFFRSRPKRNEQGFRYTAEFYFHGKASL